MTTYDPVTKRLLPESFTRLEMIHDSIAELKASRAEIAAEVNAVHRGAIISVLINIDRMIAELERQAKTIDHDHGDTCGDCGVGAGEHADDCPRL